jgi:hypothetical protein
MAAGLGFKDFVTGEVLTAADVDGYLMQGVWVFASATARDAAVTSPQEGNFAYLKDTNVTTYYTGSAWANLDTTGMTNPMTTTGDTIYSSSGSTPARLGIGTAGQVLTVNSGATAPEWVTASSGGMTLISTTTLSGASVTLSSIPQTYKNLYVVIRKHLPAADSYIQLRYNGVTSAKYFASNNVLFYSSNPVTNGALVTEADFTGAIDTDGAVSNNNYSLTIEDYTNTTTYKITYSRYVKTDATTTTSNYMGQNVHIYAETTAISSITLFNSGSTNFTSGTVLLYGVS